MILCFFFIIFLLLKTSFNDITIEYYQPFLAFAESNKWIEGKAEKKFGFNDVVTVKEFSAMLLRALGHDTMGENYAKVMDLAKEQGLFKGAMVEENANLVRGIAFILMNNTLETAPKGEDKPLKKILGYVNANAGALEVSSIKADSAKTIAVSFNREVIEEEAKELKFVVLRGKTEIKVEAKWNNENNMVSLENKNTFAVGDYTVTVMKGEEEFAKQDIKFEQQKVTKIDILSEAVAVNPKDGNGYVIFRVYDQYEKDITEQHLGNAVQVNLGMSAGTLKNNPTVKNGVIKMEPKDGQTLLSYPQIPVTIFDQSSGVSVTKTLPTAAKVGSISEFKFTPDKDIVIVDGDLATTVEIPFEAIDQTGQKTTNYELIKDGLILRDGTDELLTSIAQVKVRVMKDPKDGSKAKIVAQFSGAPVGVNMDLNVIVTALLWNGKNSNMNITLKQANELHTFRLLSPMHVVAQGDASFELPFEALDKEGNRLTKFYQLNKKVDLNGGAVLKQKANGDAYIKVDGPFTKNKPIFITSLVRKTGNFSQVQIVVQDEHAPKTLKIDDAASTIALEDGIVWDYAFGNKGIEVLDQYSRPRGVTTNERLLVRTSDDTVMKVTAIAGVSSVNYKDKAYEIYTGGQAIALPSQHISDEKEKNVEISFVLVDVSANAADSTKWKTIDEKKVRFVVVPSANIKSYDFHPATKAYANANDLLNLRDRDIAYGVDGYATGRTDSGITNVELDPTNTSYRFEVGNPNEFVVDVVSNKIVAGKPLNNKTESKTNVAMTLTHHGNPVSHAYELTGTTELPTAEAIRFRPGHDEDGVIEFTLDAFKAMDGKWLQNFIPKSDAANYDMKTGANRAAMYFEAKDSYGGWGRLDLSYGLALQDSDRLDKAFVTQIGQLDTKQAKAGDVYKLTATSPKDGVIYTVKIFIKPFVQATTDLEVLKVETTKLGAMSEDKEVTITFNRNVHEDAKAKANYEINSSAIDNDGVVDGNKVTIKVPAAQFTYGQKLEIKSGIRVEGATDATNALQNDVIKYLELKAPYNWVDVKPVFEVTKAEVITHYGLKNVEVKVTFTDDVTKLPQLAEAILFETSEKAAKAIEHVAGDSKSILIKFEDITWTNYHRFTLDNTTVSTDGAKMAAEYVKLLDETNTAHMDAVPVNAATFAATPSYVVSTHVSIDVTFNTEVNKDWAQTLTNFKIDGKDPATAVFDETGKKKVTLTYAIADYVDTKDIVILAPQDQYKNAYPNLTYTLDENSTDNDPTDDTWTLKP